jgi:hypothetical protein
MWWELRLGCWLRALLLLRHCSLIRMLWLRALLRTWLLWLRAPWLRARWLEPRTAGYTYLDRTFRYSWRVRALTFYTSHHEVLLGPEGHGADAAKRGYRAVHVPADAEVGSFADQVRTPTSRPQPNESSLSLCLRGLHAALLTARLHCDAEVSTRVHTCRDSSRATTAAHYAALRVARLPCGGSARDARRHLPRCRRRRTQRRRRTRLPQEAAHGALHAERLVFPQRLWRERERRRRRWPPPPPLAAAYRRR